MEAFGLDEEKISKLITANIREGHLLHVQTADKGLEAWQIHRTLNQYEVITLSLRPHNENPKPRQQQQQPSTTSS